MKKLLCFVVALAVGSAAFALDLSMGVKGSFNLPSVGSSFGDGAFKSDMDATAQALESLDMTVSNGGLGGNLQVFANFGIFKSEALALGIQPEFGVGFNAWYYLNATGSQLGQTYSLESPFGWITMDIPVLFTLDIKPLSWLGIQLGVGPQFSLAFLGGGDQTLYLNGEEQTDVMSLGNDDIFPLVGMVFEANAKFYVGKTGMWAILAGVKYSMDFTPTKFNVSENETQVSAYDGSEAFRRYLGITVGVQQSLRKR